MQTIRNKIITQHKISIDYHDIYIAMQEFTKNRTANDDDEIWVVKHQPVFTLGLSGLEEHILFTQHDIPIIKCDRGGQVTYHGPGQIVIYLLIDLQRRNLHTRNLVDIIENSIIDVLFTYGITAYSDKSAPGVYIQQQKIASVGLHIHRNCSYHGLSFNIDMNLTPFTYINVCGYKNLQVTQLKNFIPNININIVEQDLLIGLINKLSSHSK